MSAEHEGLERKHQRLEPQDQGVHEAERINNVKNHASDAAGVFCDDRVMFAGMGIGDATAAGRDIVEPAFVERLEGAILPVRPLGVALAEQRSRPLLQPPRHSIRELLSRTD
jgi:hypothetical protein